LLVLVAWRVGFAQHDTCRQAGETRRPEIPFSAKWPPQTRTDRDIVPLGEAPLGKHPEAQRREGCQEGPGAPGSGRFRR